MVTKTLDAYTTICPPGASVTVPPQSEPASIGTVDAAIVHVITEVTHLHKLPKPAVHTFYEPEPQKPTAQRINAAEIFGTSSRSSDITTSSLESVIPLVSELPMAIQKEEEHLSHNVTTPQMTKQLQTEEPPAPTIASGGSETHGQSWRYLYLFTMMAAAVMFA